MTALAPQFDTQLEHLLIELMRLVTQRTAGQTLQVMLDAELSMPQVVTLLMLQRCGSKSVSAIAARLQLSPAATSQLIHGLVRRKLVTRKEDDSDRRVKMIALLPAAQALLDQMAQSRSDEIAASMALLPANTRQQATIALAGVVEYMQALPEDVGATPAS